MKNRLYIGGKNEQVNEHIDTTIILSKNSQIDDQKRIVQQIKCEEEEIINERMRRKLEFIQMTLKKWYIAQVLCDIPYLFLIKKRNNHVTVCTVTLFVFYIHYLFSSNVYCAIFVCHIYFFKKSMLCKLCATYTFLIKKKTITLLLTVM